MADWEIRLSMRFLSRLEDAKLPDEILRELKGKIDFLRGNRIRYLGG